MKGKTNNADESKSFFSTSGTLRETLESLKEEPDFQVTIRIGGEADAEEGDV